MAFELIALLCTGLFAGAAIYVSLAEHPARVACGTAVAVAQFRPSYRRAALMQATLAAAGCLAAIGAWAAGRGVVALVGGLLLGAAIPFTLSAIMSTTTRLMDPALDASSPEAAALLARWGRLHAFRSAAGALALALLAFDVMAPR